MSTRPSAVKAAQCCFGRGNVQRRIPRIIVFGHVVAAQSFATWTQRRRRALNNILSVCSLQTDQPFDDSPAPYCIAITSKAYSALHSHFYLLSCLTKYGKISKFAPGRHKCFDRVNIHLIRFVRSLHTNVNIARICTYEHNDELFCSITARIRRIHVYVLIDRHLYTMFNHRNDLLLLLANKVFQKLSFKTNGRIKDKNLVFKMRIHQQ